MARRHPDLPLADVERLLASEVHEQYRRAGELERARLVRFYLDHLDRVNNWDLVDVSADRILGEHLAGRSRDVLFELARSESVWERRVAIVATAAFIKRGEAAETLRLAERLLADEHDLIHKAVGWMLREVGKRVGESLLEAFLEAHAAAMPRTMLRYAVERLPAERRRRFMAMRAPMSPSGGARARSARIEEAGSNR